MIRSTRRAGRRRNHFSDWTHCTVPEILGILAPTLFSLLQY
jgi:hypothetical protein